MVITFVPAGIRRMIFDMEFMLGSAPSELMYYSWNFICPICTLVSVRLFVL